MADRVEIRIFTDGTLEEVSPIVARFPARMVRILSRDHPSPPPNASANATEEWKLDHDAVSALHNLASADVLVAQQSSFSQPTLAISPAQIRFRPGGRLSSIRSAVTVPQGTGAQMERVWDLLDLRWRDYLKALKEDAGRWAGEWDCPMGRARNWDGGGFGIPL
ncbi:hypothetical protein DFJ74DRAFT_661449 [Hyaloraphidium curvatum]|nr:hypothetical protein DFJ74DRAFT_661449 [Hyaloraphidium curvatum]